MTTIYTYNNKVLKNSSNDKWLKKYVDPYNPLGLDPGVFRIQINTSSWQGNHTATLVPGTTDTYDVQDFVSYSYNRSIVVKVLGANARGITSFQYLFTSCNHLTEVALFDTSSATNMGSMFLNCSSLTSIPLFDTSSVTDVSYMFNRCTNVESGALAMYNQFAALGEQITNKGSASGLNSLPFYDCGSNTTTGAAELAQIPSSWGGTGD